MGKTTMLRTAFATGANAKQLERARGNAKAATYKQRKDKAKTKTGSSYFNKTNSSDSQSSKP